MKKQDSLSIVSLTHFKKRKQKRGHIYLLSLLSGAFILSACQIDQRTFPFKSPTNKPSQKIASVQKMLPAHLVNIKPEKKPSEGSLFEKVLGGKSKQKLWGRIILDHSKSFVKNPEKRIHNINQTLIFLKRLHIEEGDDIKIMLVDETLKELSIIPKFSEEKLRKKLLREYQYDEHKWGTIIGEALNSITSELQNPQNEHMRKLVVVLTDGFDEATHNPQNQNINPNIMDNFAQTLKKTPQSHFVVSYLEPQNKFKFMASPLIPLNPVLITEGEEQLRADGQPAIWIEKSLQGVQK